MAIAIKVENISKAYQLGEIGTGTISRDLERWIAKVRGKEDPFLKIGEANDRTQKGTSDIVWSLKDINFEINEGDAVGIIGRNGAGKSTLLKILSRVTSPTTGSIKVKGRIASLLEVGTGFHPELTGKENIYLNGAILGMRKKEITRKFDEIVDFSGVERYIDTPVKRYSSGMYVRLAFAVAAYLESETLIVDEVLAVGDLEFQRKCLGKMGEVSKGEGRTVLFVSHNMGSIKNLCTHGVYLKNGQIKKSGKINSVIEEYFVDVNANINEDRSHALTNKNAAFCDWNILGSNNDSTIKTRDTAQISIDFVCKKNYKSVELGLIIRDYKGEIVFGCNSLDGSQNAFDINPGRYKFKFQVRLPLRHGQYEFDFAIVSQQEILDHWIPAKKLTIVSEFDSKLGEEWLGILNESSIFNYETES